MTDVLDIEHPDSLIAYLRRTGRIDADEQPIARTLQGGVSNRTVWLQRANGKAWVIKQALAKLRVQVDWFSSPERIHREAEGLRWLALLAPIGTTPELVFEDHEQHVLAMSAIPQPHDNWKTLLLAGQVETRHIEQFSALLGTIHRTAYEQRAAVAAAFEDRTFFESLRVEPYYSYTAEQVPKAAAFIHALIDETRATRLTLVHGDYSPKNILVYQDRLILLDYEVIHWGDPAFDLGFSMTHLLSKAHHVTAKRVEFGEATRHYWRTYYTALGNVEWADGLEARAVRHTLACLLARVAGRSKLEYMAEVERARQRQVVVQMMSAPPRTVGELVQGFISGLKTTTD